MAMIPSLGLSLTLYLSSLLIHGAAGQPSDPQGMTVTFRPSVAIVIGVFSIMFSLTFLLLLYAKFCHSADPSVDLFGGVFPDSGALLPPPERGLDKAAIESLPFFRFSSLRGARGGLECAVCLSRFEDAELLRLLPGCKHAFHLACVDRWLEASPSCPLCRRAVDAADGDFFRYATGSSRRLLSDRRDDAAADEVDLFVEREPGVMSSGQHGGSSRSFSIGGSFRKLERIITTSRPKKEEPPPPSDQYHKLKHRIVAADAVFKLRWSDLNSSDLMSLNSEMLSLTYNSSKRFDQLGPGPTEDIGSGSGNGFGPFEGRRKASADERALLRIKEEMERKRLLESKATAAGISRPPSGGAPWPSERDPISPAANGRSMSEITELSRFRVVTRQESGIGSKDERRRRLWLPIARRTVQWLAGRERRSSQLQSPDDSAAAIV